MHVGNCYIRYNLTDFCKERSSGMWFLLNMTGHSDSPERIFPVSDDGHDVFF